VYFDLATWHLINTVYAPARVAELRGMKGWYAEPRHHARLMTTVQERLGHALAAAAEQAKIDVATTGPGADRPALAGSRAGRHLQEARRRRRWKPTWRTSSPPRAKPRARPAWRRGTWTRCTSRAAPPG
jgi:hypothetical protein